MKPAIKASKIYVVKRQLLSPLEFKEVNFIAVQTKHSGITILN